MRALFACEESQACAIAFRECGIEAYSCDLLPASGGRPEWHIQADVCSVLDWGSWDLIGAFPPCTHLAASGARWFPEKRKDGRQKEAVEFFMFFVKRIARGWIENPIGIMSSIYRKPDQIIQPWQYGHGEVKATCLWLYGLPLLQSTNVVEGRMPRVWRMPPSPDRSTLRSKTYSGIAAAMAAQWGGMQ